MTVTASEARALTDAAFEPHVALARIQARIVEAATNGLTFIHITRGEFNTCGAALRDAGFAVYDNAPYSDIVEWEDYTRPQTLQVLTRVVEAAYNIFMPARHSCTITAAFPPLECEHGNAGLSAWWCDECWMELEDALKVAGYNTSRESWEVWTSE